MQESTSGESAEAQQFGILVGLARVCRLSSGAFKPLAVLAVEARMSSESSIADSASMPSQGSHGQWPL